MITFNPQRQNTSPQRPSGFPPAKGNRMAIGRPDGRPTATGPASTGSGGLKKSLARKRAGTKESPGVEKNIAAS